MKWQTVDRHLAMVEKQRRALGLRHGQSWQRMKRPKGMLTRVFIRRVQTLAYHEAEAERTLLVYMSE